MQLKAALRLPASETGQLELFTVPLQVRLQLQRTIFALGTTASKPDLLQIES